jgi:hypothetical protein
MLSGDCKDKDGDEYYSEDASSQRKEDEMV